MVSTIFRQELKKATGVTWEKWIAKLQDSVNPTWSHEQIKNHICDTYGATEEWGEWLAVIYGQLLGRLPSGITKDAGVQIGVRKTVALTKEQAWNWLVSPQGLRWWIGNVASFQAQKGFEFTSAEGVTGTLSVVEPYHKLRMTWQRKEWEKPSRLQMYVLSTQTGKTTIAIHQEMLEDVYMREMMRRHWDEMLNHIIDHVVAGNK
ncbi:SRPBCC domain-containing protein [Paenibacillus thalictri]|uniref:SRPBCC domain-containing protein n=1 Tax=Paenibacillus thalictri TaxID=2527873 RepID=A0A4Q9DVE4_9BACL|nr:SRPBCC domain-containing protein [Paenibacillus thalictri]TBL81007.1 SRPBCC domain-containing protein [Paenibacillus thalictri]